MYSKILNIFSGILFFFMTLSLGGCGRYADTESIDLTREDKVSVHDIFSEVRIVIPETHPDYLIGTISSAEYYKGRFYLFDRKSQKVFCVDEKGQFQFKISARGHGPEEYVHISHMSIDSFNDQILLMEASMQRLQAFDMEGNHAATYNITAETPLAYNWAFALNTDTLLLISIMGDQLIFFCRDELEIIQTEFPMAIAEGIFPFSPSDMSFYQFNNRSYYLPVLGQKVADVTEMQPNPYFKWDFGPDNNSPGQYERLYNELAAIGPQASVKLYQDFVGRDKIINQAILKVAETTRYKMAVVEFDEDYKNIIIDKKEGTYFVFSGFSEEISLLYLNVSDDMALGSPTLPGRVPEALSHRVLSSFHPSVLSEADKKRLKDWDEMEDNPFLVVYKFKE